MISEGGTVLVALALSVAIGLWLFAQFSSAGGAAVAVFGLLRNGILFLTGVFLIISGAWPFIIAGGLFIIAAIFLGGAHVNNLDNETSLRRRISG